MCLSSRKHCLTTSFCMYPGSYSLGKRNNLLYFLSAAEDWEYQAAHPCFFSQASLCICVFQEFPPISGLAFHHNILITYKFLICFSVRPPKKSWKKIFNLSGGEKTLSSLALVFALHHYKPTPLYFMDEIDAALDFKNVSIVAFYIYVSI